MIRKKTKNRIIFSIKNKYKNILYPNNYVKEFNQLKLNIIKKDNLINIKKNKRNFYKVDNFQSSILKIYKKKKISSMDKKILILFFKKYNANLKIYGSYDKKYKPTTKKETHFYSYIFLAYLIIKLKEINNLQKLNFLLKIHDKILLNLSKINADKVFLLFKKNLITEMKYLQSYI
tara:strand:+ start:198 stop:725 length:528 start_codon:yes stop_codon:yes gene_type:complete